MAAKKNRTAKPIPVLRPKISEVTPEMFCASIIEATDALSKQMAKRRALQQVVINPADLEQLRKIDRQIWDIWETN